MSITDRLIALYRRRIAAKQIGINFTRAAEWKIPQKIVVSKIPLMIKGPGDLGSDNAFLDIFLDDCYGLKKYKNSEEVKTILDIGAHIGLFSIYAKSLFTNATIHAYEPNPELAQYISYHALNSKYKFYTEAVGLHAGRISLHKEDDSVHTATFDDPKGDIPKVSFAECVARLGGKVDLLKLDCEGAEWEIFQTDKKVWNNVRYITMEYHLINGHKLEDLKNTIRELGFTLLKVLPTGPTWGLLEARNQK